MSAPTPTALAEPVVLENEHVRLEPLEQRHAADLSDAVAGLDYAWYTAVPASIPEEIEARRARHAAGEMNPWAIVRDGRAVGMTTYCPIDQTNRRVEVGFTWLSPAVQRTAVNTAAKLLLLEHAFERCDVIAVQLCTHWHNHRSRAAIERLGAKRDGVLRNHRLGPDGTLRDTVVYSILPHEWPAVRLGLRARLARD